MKRVGYLKGIEKIRHKVSEMGKNIVYTSQSENY